MGAIQFDFDCLLLLTYLLKYL